MRARYRERWRSVRTRDIGAIGWYAARGVTTMPSGGGPVGRFEERFASATGARYALMMNSGTATLHSAFFAVGVKPGDEVIVPPYTFFATAAPILQLGGVPVFCDIDEETLTADPTDVERRITGRTRAICVVHVWGNPAPLDRFVDIARRHGVALVEDCSHAHGAFYRGRSVGRWGDVGCFSLQGNKPVTGGEAGVAITDSASYYDRMLALGHNGRTATQQAAGTFGLDNASLGLKYRPHLAAAAWALASLDRLDELNARRGAQLRSARRRARRRHGRCADRGASGRTARRILRVRPALRSRARQWLADRFLRSCCAGRGCSCLRRSLHAPGVRCRLAARDRVVRRDGLRRARRSTGRPHGRPACRWTGRTARRCRGSD